MRCLALHGTGVFEEDFFVTAPDSLCLGERHGSGFRGHERVMFDRGDPPAIVSGRIICAYVSVGSIKKLRGSPDPKSPEELKRIQHVSILLRLNTLRPDPRTSGNGYWTALRGNPWVFADAHVQRRFKDNGKQTGRDSLLVVPRGTLIRMSPLGATEDEEHLFFEFPERDSPRFFRGPHNLVTAEEVLGSRIGKSYPTPVSQ